MFDLNKISLDFLLGILVGASSGMILVIVLFTIDCIREARQEKGKKKQKELSLGKDLDDFKVPDFLPHDLDTDK